MFKKQTSGSVICRTCRNLVGVNDPVCFNCGTKNPGLWGYAPLLQRLGQDLGFVNFVTALCVIFYLLSLAVDPTNIGMQGMMNMLSPSIQGLFLLGASGAVPVFQYGRWWTFLSAAFLHGSLLHIGLNLYWIRQLGPLTADVYGAGRMVILYTAGSVVGFAASTMAGAVFGQAFLIGGGMFTVGASAPIFGLLGALVYSGPTGGSSEIGRQARSLALVLFLLGFVLPNVDNWAHAGGFVGGFLAGQFLDPVSEERLNHLVGALVCLALILLSILWSVLTGLRFIQ